MNFESKITGKKVSRRKRQARSSTLLVFLLLQSVVSAENNFNRFKSASRKNFTIAHRNRKSLFSVSITGGRFTHERDDFSCVLVESESCMCVSITPNFFVHGEKP